ncbi:hypothetical protein C8F01DRAFT_1234952 [Mycena amicta]|nr:hypothetical protein C8F01DRAFT_1234952 [Mycena amicta]
MSPRRLPGCKGPALVVDCLVRLRPNRVDCAWERRQTRDLPREQVHWGALRRGRRRHQSDASSRGNIELRRDERLGEEGDGEGIRVHRTKGQRRSAIGFGTVDRSRGVVLAAANGGASTMFRLVFSNLVVVHSNDRFGTVSRLAVGKVDQTESKPAKQRMMHVCMGLHNYKGVRSLRSRPGPVREGCSGQRHADSLLDIRGNQNLDTTSCKRKLNGWSLTNECLTLKKMWRRAVESRLSRRQSRSGTRDARWSSLQSIGPSDVRTGVGRIERNDVGNVGMRVWMNRKGNECDKSRLGFSLYRANRGRRDLVSEPRSLARQKFDEVQVDKERASADASGVSNAISARSNVDD